MLKGLQTSIETDHETRMVLQWQHQGNECGGYGARMHSVAFGCSPRCGEFSVIRRLALLASDGGQKNAVRQLRKSAVWLIRPKSSSGSGSVVRGYAGVCGVRGPASGCFNTGEHNG